MIGVFSVVRLICFFIEKWFFSHAGIQHRKRTYEVSKHCERGKRMLERTCSGCVNGANEQASWAGERNAWEDLFRLCKWSKWMFGARARLKLHGCWLPAQRVPARRWWVKEALISVICYWWLYIVLYVIHCLTAFSLQCLVQMLVYIDFIKHLINLPVVSFTFDQTPFHIPSS